MSTLSSGRGIIWASKGGGGRRESICSGVLLLDKTDVRREETQKNTVQQDALLKGTQRGTRWSMAYGGKSTDLCVWAHIWKVGARQTWSEWGQPHAVTLQRGLPQGVWKLLTPRTQVPQKALLDLATTPSPWWNPGLRYIFTVASLLVTGDTRE